MLLLHHDHHEKEMQNEELGDPLILHFAFFLFIQNGAPGRTRTDDYGFTKLALLLLRPTGALKMASTAGIAPATSTFARWRSDLTELRGLFECRIKNANEES